VKQQLYKYRYYLTVILIVFIILNSVPKIINATHTSIPVLVTSKNLEIGTKLKADDVIVKNVVKGIMPNQILTNDSQIIGKQTSTFIPAGAVLSELMLSDIGVLNNIPKNKVIVSVKIANGQTLKPGDKIDIVGKASEYNSNTDSLANNAIVMENNDLSQLAVSRNEAEKILNCTDNTKILAILVH
jgi:Flp pilus assembly protein CpaB